MRYLSAILVLLVSFNVVAEQKAVTQTGDVVILKDNGRWFYENNSARNAVPLMTNPEKFVRHKDSVFLLKSTKTNAGFWVDPNKWTFEKKDKKHSSAEYTFNLKAGDLYGMVISEQIEIDVEELVKLAFENAKKASVGMRVIKKEYRVVNGNKVIYMEMEGTIQSIKFTYLGYYFSNASGTTQYLAYTGSGFVGKYRKDIDNFLNGFVLL